MAKSGVRWQGGRDLGTAKVRVRQAGENLKAGAAEALELSIEEGAVLTQDFLEAAVTRTGEERAAERGGFPGRHDTGNMVGSVSYEIRDARSRRVWGVFGWWGGNFEQYMRDQDLGEGNIPAARALPQAFYRVRENFSRRMRDLVKGRPVD